MPARVYLLEPGAGLVECIVHRNELRLFEVARPHRVDPAIILGQGEPLTDVVIQQRGAQHHDVVVWTGFDLARAEGVARVAAPLEELWLVQSLGGHVQAHDAQGDDAA